MISRSCRLLVIVFLVPCSLLASCAKGAEFSAEYRLDEAGALIYSSEQTDENIIANIDASAVTFDVYIAEQYSKNFLVRESRNNSRTTIIVPLLNSGRYDRAFEFSIDLMASSKAGAPQWRGTEVILGKPSTVDKDVWDELTAAFESADEAPVANARNPDLGTFIPVDVYRSGKFLKKQTYYLAENDSGAIDIKRLGNFSTCNFNSREKTAIEMFAGTTSDGPIVDLELDFRVAGKIVGRYRVGYGESWEKLTGEISGKKIIIKNSGDKLKPRVIFSGNIDEHAARGLWRFTSNNKDMLISCAKI